MGWAGNIVKNTLGKLPEAIIGLAGDVLGGNNSAKQSAKQAQKQMDFQERMSSTSYQRATADMIKAGLNPLLAYTQGGASTPSGAMGDVPDQSHIGSRSVANYATATQIANVKANTQKTQAETLLTQENWQRQLMDNWITKNKYGRATESNSDGYKGGAFEADMDKLRAEADIARSRANVTNSEDRIRQVEARIAEATVDSKISSARSLAAIQDKQVTYQELQNTLAQLKLPEAEALAKWFDTVGAASPAAKATMTIAQWLKFILGR